jgi:hypothetical protein
MKKIYSLNLQINSKKTTLDPNSKFLGINHNLVWVGKKVHHSTIPSSYTRQPGKN